MTTATPSTALVMIQPIVTDAERRALAGYLAGYRGLTREAYALDLRQFTTWCRARSLNLFAKCAVEEELLEHSPAAHVRRPPVDYESHAVALDRDELDALTPRRRIQPPGSRRPDKPSRAGTQMPPARATSQQDWATCGGQSVLRVQGARTGQRVRRPRLRL